MYKAAIVIVSCAVCFIAALLGGLVALGSAPPSHGFGSASDNVLPLLPTATNVVVGTGDTTVVASSTGRQLLELGNVGTTSQAIYCNFGDRPAVLYQGLTIQASTTKTFNLDNLYRGAIHCIAPVKPATISVVDF